MRPFNLAEAKIAERSYCKDYLRRRLRFMALLVALTVLIAVASFGCRITVASDAARLTSSLGDMQGRCVRVKREMAALKAKSSQRKWQQQLTKGSSQWLGVLDAMLRTAPSNVWLNRVESSLQSSTVSVEGLASSFASLSLFMNGLRSSPRFADARLTNTRAVILNNAAFLEFVLVAKLKTAPAGTTTDQAPAQPAGVPRVQEAP
jgi:Tfp pilus assembly protein PilN